jgi:hypothetical protein
MRGIACIFGLVAAATGARADTVFGSGFFIPVPVLGGTTGSPYWNNPSLDGSYMNIGYFLTGTGGFPAGCGSNTQCGTSYLGNGGQYLSSGPYLSTGPKVPDDPADFSFLRTSTAIQIAVLGSFSGNNPANPAGGMTTIGFYDASAPNAASAAASEVPLWAAGQIARAVGTSTTMRPPYANYGLYETVCVSSVLTSGGYQCSATATYFSNSNFNPAGQTGFQHFAIFDLYASPDVYFVGIEESPANSTIEGLGDYNDLIFEITSINQPGVGNAPPATPEPTTISLVGLGLAVIGFVMARRAV